jgi:two-component system sensor histidine kinase AdeS
VTATVLRQVVRILLDNAIRYAAPGPVHIVATRVVEGLLVRVDDAGPSEIERLGSPAHGAGMGLDLCRMLLHRVGGQLTRGAGVDRGTSFEIRLPVAIR